MIKLGIAELIISLLIGAFIESVSAERILFLEPLLSDRCSTWLLSHSTEIMGFLLVLNVIVYIWAQCNTKSQKQTEIYNSICKMVFEEFVKKNEVVQDCDCRVTIFKFCRSKMSEDKLKSVGRYESSPPYKKAKISFLIGEGCAGKALRLNKIVALEIDEFDEMKPLAYVEQCESHLNLPKRKVAQLNKKCAGYYCIPLPFFQSDRPWGVLSLDCVKKGVITNQINVREIENAVLHYSALLGKENVR